MQCTEAGVVIALRRRAERMRILHEKKEGCLKSASIMASLVVTDKMCCRITVCQVSEQFNRMHGSDSCSQEGSVRFREFTSDGIHQESGIQENSGEIRQ